MFSKEKRISWKQWALILLVPILLLAGAGGVYAYITAKTDDLTNQFDPVEVTCRVEETFDGSVKQDVRIRNTGDINGFIRAMVVISWVDSNGRVLAASPVEGVDYTIEWGDSTWIKGSDGYWYHSVAVQPNGTTGCLIKSLTPAATPTGCHLQAQILASAIQSDPPAAAETAWGVGVSGYAITPP